jgi:hypothetical protein
MRDNILKSVTEFIDKNTNNNIEIKNKELVFESSKYSSTKENIWHVIINDIKLKKTSEYTIGYNCIHCNSKNYISTTSFLRKIRKNNDLCSQCIITNSQCIITNSQCRITKLNSDEMINLKKNNLQLKNNKPNINLKEKLSYEEIHKLSINEFNNQHEIFKNSYLLSHLTEEDYERIKSKIKSYSNGSLNKINDYEFWSVYKVNNQMKYSSVLYDTINKIIFKANQPIIKCDNCSNEWRAKSLDKLKNCYKILCPNCSLCNKIFKIRSTKNILNENILYQSKLEMKFIKWCESLNIVVNNGPNINYNFENKDRIYKVDFMISNILIEIKDNHIWHKNELKTGKFDAKRSAAEKYIIDNKLNKYYLISPNNWNQMTKEIENYLKN